VPGSLSSSSKKQRKGKDALSKASRSSSKSPSKYKKEKKQSSSGGSSESCSLEMGAGEASYAGPGWSGNAASLAEQRDASLHSSQQKIKVVIGQ
jgi:hypothetical protein